MAEKQLTFRKTLALKLTLIIEAVLILSIVTVSAVHLRRELSRIDEDAAARMNLTVALVPVSIVRAYRHSLLAELGDEARAALPVRARSGPSVRSLPIARVQASGA